MTTELESLQRTIQKDRVLIEALNLEIGNLKNKIANMNEAWSSSIDLSEFSDSDAVILKIENQQLKDKVNEYGKLYGVERGGGYLKIKNIIKEIGDEYGIMLEHGSGATLYCIKQACIDIRRQALKLIGIIASTEQERTEDITRILKRQQSID